MSSVLTRDQVATLASMLTYCRPHGSVTESLFVARFLSPLTGITRDAFGNYHVIVGESPILWSSHTDTVHRSSGTQRVKVNEGQHTIRLARRARKCSNCLGADDTVGVFLMIEMIKAQVPGHYVFHYGEEVGGVGSSDLAKYSPEVLDGISFAIALDRAGTSDVITDQAGGRCCSDVFAWSLAQALGLPYKPAHGIYTDTAEYTHLIPECTNLSVGYYRQHSSDEYVDYAHVGVLLSALCAMDQSALVVARDPHEVITRTWNRYVCAGDEDTDDTWCYVCDAPILGDDDPIWDETPIDLIECCVCSPDDRDIDNEESHYRGLSTDDAKFLRYLRER